MATADLLRHRLELVYRWYAGMVNADTGVLEYLYLPEADTCIREPCLVRDIAAVWDVAVLGDFLGRDDLRPVVERSLRHYAGYIVEQDGYLIPAADRLGEPASIAHSAFLLLAFLHAPPPRPCREVAGLAEGLLHQQRPDGSYRVYFADRPDAGEELYPGEAMLALLETYRRVRDGRYLSSAARGLAYYDAGYFRRGRVGDDLLVFFANWQSQAGRLLADFTPGGRAKEAVVDYLYRMHDRVIGGGFYDAVRRHPARQSAVAVACALEGLTDAYALARDTDPGRASRYRGCVRTGLAYLLGLQSTGGEAGRERGGFGMSLGDRAQRIDVTGHAASAFMKAVATGVECEPPAG